MPKRDQKKVIRAVVATLVLGIVGLVWVVASTPGPARPAPLPIQVTQVNWTYASTQSAQGSDCGIQPSYGYGFSGNESGVQNVSITLTYTAHNGAGCYLQTVVALTPHFTVIHQTTPSELGYGVSGTTTGTLVVELKLPRVPYTGPVVLRVYESLGGPG